MIKRYLLAAPFLALSAFSAQAGTVDVIDASDGQAGTYFVPTDAQKYNSPYYRGKGQDWSWQHSAISGTWSTATLNISAFDVDWPSEVDEIWAEDSGTWVKLGALTGTSDAWAFGNEFALGANFNDDIAAGLKVLLKIDTATSGSWIVTLAKSALSLDGGSLPPPAPGQVPLPAGIPLIASALAAFGALRMRRKSA